MSFLSLPYHVLNFRYLVLLVPIYDARTANFRVNSESLKSIGTKLPKFVGEAPEHSMVVVAYSLSTYSENAESTSGYGLSPNIMWVAVLGEAEGL